MSAKRNFTTLLKKYKIIQDVEEKKRTPSEIARQHGIASSALYTILKMREEIVNAVQKEGHNLQAKSLRGAMHVDLEQAMSEWYSQQKAQNIPISGPTMQRKANEFAVRLGIENFKSSSGWVERFKTRRGISGIKVNGDSPLVNRRSRREWLLFLQNALGRYQPQDVYSTDELGMFHNLMPDRTLSVKRYKYKDVERRKERRLTVLLCCNMDGSDKMKPLVIGKFKKPRCLEDIILPCDYDFNEEVGMTTAVFMKWLSRFDAKMGAVDRKVILFVNSCLAHPASDRLRNVELVIVPKNVIDTSRPLNQEYSSSQEVGLLRAVEGIVASWKAVHPAMIVNCFRDAHFVPPVSEGAAIFVPSNVAGAEHFAAPLDGEAAILVLPITADTEYPDDPLQLDTKPQLDSMEPQAVPLTAPQSVTLTLIEKCDEESWQKLSADSLYEEFVILDDNVAVGTFNAANIAKGQQGCSVEDVEIEEEPHDIPTMREGDIFARMLKHRDASEEMWSQFNRLKDFVK
ncbi:hypothetical protein PR048_033479 [Dryococelus australis]|uniref:HTH CENPB-type domain-containing protein n=1 Tax=Dryococelus australis TaxID=614101 RepID=A0ABQ9G0E9_9NEOP|nr:hypothetical protein PR048_033479 [Dryococelus australis]